MIGRLIDRLDDRPADPGSPALRSSRHIPRLIDRLDDRPADRPAINEHQ
jgi:hypothetical protein